MFRLGDVIEIYSPTASKPKYHLCIGMIVENEAAKFLFLNSDPHSGSFDVDCARVPFLEPSRTGRTAFSFTFMPRYNERQLELYRAAYKGTIDCALAQDIKAAAQANPVLSGSERRLVVACLDEVIAHLCEGEVL